jgi:hypothetical protein
MIKIFFTTFFFAELIITLFIISKIYQVNKYANKLNKIILKNQIQTKLNFLKLRAVFLKSSKKVQKIKKNIKEKSQEYSLYIFKTLFTYLAILLIKGKYKKTLLVYQFIKEVSEIMLEI